LQEGTLLCYACPSFCMGQVGFRWKDYHETSRWEFVP